MAAIDKAAIAWTIAIVAFGAGIAGLGDNLQSSSSVTTTTPPPPPVVEESMMEDTMEESMMEETMEAETMEEVMEDTMEESMMEEVMEEEVMEETMEAEMMQEEVTEAETIQESGPQTVTVIIEPGTSLPGCEETDECFTPSTVSINAGDTVSWDNIDTAAHTVTGGNVVDGPSGEFDSGLLSPDNTFEVTFDSPGDNDYYCIIHPWMFGVVQVS